jgi:hypothetical protein
MMKIFGLNKHCLLRPVKHDENIRFEKNDRHCLLGPEKNMLKMFEESADTACCELSNMLTLYTV